MMTTLEKVMLDQLTRIENRLKSIETQIKSLDNALQFVIDEIEKVEK